MIRKGMSWMQRAARGNIVSRYHIEASIAWEHCRSPHFDQTDWNRISELYGAMVGEQSSAYCLNRLSHAEFFTKGADAAITRLRGFFGARDCRGEKDSGNNPFSSHELAAGESLLGWIYLRTQRHNKQSIRLGSHWIFPKSSSNRSDQTAFETMRNRKGQL